MTAKRLLLVSSDRSRDFETLSAEAYFKTHAYSVGAILHHLEQQGWETRRAGLRTTASFKNLARCIDTFKPNVVYTYGSTVALNPLICRRMFCCWKAFKVIHGWDDLYGDIWGDLAGWPGRMLMNSMEKQIVTRSDQVVTLSRFLQQRGRTWGVECHYIPNGADIPVFDRASCDIRLKGDFNLVYTGDQARWKRTAEICAAMRHVPSHIKLYLTGQRYAYLDPYVSDNCIFLGYVSRNDQLCVMDQADVLVSTADQDCNAKLQEYLRFHKPILGYDGRMNLFFRNGHHALLTRDYPEAILRLYRDPGLRAALVNNAARDIPVFTWQEIASQFDALFSSFVLPSHRAGVLV